MKIFIFWKSVHQSCDFCVNCPFDFSLKKNLPNPGIELESLTSPALEGRLFSTSAPLGNHMYIYEVKVTQSCPTHTYIHTYIYIYVCIHKFAWFELYTINRKLCSFQYISSNWPTITYLWPIWIDVCCHGTFIFSNVFYYFMKIYIIYLSFLLSMTIVRKILKIFSHKYCIKTE